jgi:hypothetical protein
MKFQIEDDKHAEPQGDFNSLGEAIAELRRRAEIPWDSPPNVAPCESWRTCGRTYEIIEYDDSTLPWQERNRYGGLEVSKAGMKWTLVQ